MNLTPDSWGSELREFNACHDPQSGRFTFKGQGDCEGGTGVGITSARPGKAPRQVFNQMRDFEGRLRGISSVTNVRVAPGLGAWEGGSEPTWVVSYRGNGEARKLLAETGAKYDQDAVLIMKRNCSGPACDPAVDFSFEGGVSLSAREAIHKILGSVGLGGWTWAKVGGKTTLRMVSVPDWGGDTVKHLEAVKAASEAIAKAGWRHRSKTRWVKTEVLTRENYMKVAA